MSTISIALGKRIREIRTQKHMSQEELAFKAGISAAHLGQIERATKNPTIDTVAGISAALGVPITTLFENSQIQAPETSAIIEKINSHLLKMTADEQADFLRIVRIFHSYLPKNK